MVGIRSCAHQLKADDLAGVVKLPVKEMLVGVIGVSTLRSTTMDIEAMFILMHFAHMPVRKAHGLSARAAWCEDLGQA